MRFEYKNGQFRGRSLRYFAVIPPSESQEQAGVESLREIAKRSVYFNRSVSFDKLITFLIIQGLPV